MTMGKGFPFRATAGLTVVLLAYLADGFYLPGLPPVWYCKNPNSRLPWQETEPSLGCQAEIPIFVNSLNSLQTVLQFEYSSFDFCLNPNKGDQGPVENLGQVLLGDRIEPSPYKLTFLKDETCVEVCTRHYNRGIADQDEKLKFLIRGIRLNYQHQWIIDNLPIVGYYTVADGSLYGSTGFPIGCYVDIKGVQKDDCVISLKPNQTDTYYVFNHVDILITYNNASYPGYDVGRLLYAKIQPRSLKEVNTEETGCGMNSPPLGINLLDHEHKITYSYSVRFVVNNDIRWTSRWDYLLGSNQNNYNIVWFSIHVGNSLILVLFFSGCIATIMSRMLRKDLTTHDENAEEKKCVELLHGDVFRAPDKQMMLSVLVGNGIQLFFMTLLTLFFASLGFLSPANEGALVTWSLKLYVCLGIPAGYVSARIYKSFKGEKWGLNVLLTAVLCPGVVFLIFSMMNLILWIKRSSAAIPVTAHLKLLALWFGISLPLTFVGAYFGFKKKIIEDPVIPNKIPRLIPDMPHYKRLVGIMLGGLYSIICFFVHLNPILGSILTNQVYDMYGFLFLEFIILVVICSEATIILCYFHLWFAGDYRWWWRSYLTGGSTAVYFVIYCIHYYMSTSEIQGAVSVFLYFGYTFIMAFLLFLLTGSVGFCACFWFVSKIYRVGNYKRVNI